ncbi:MAG: hypothetical protein EB067_06720, partial [Actinobacteria bacterium]|nr:hypothetical protein [Actinomycetota bacterium]
TALSIVYSGSRVSNTTVYSIKLYKSSDNSSVASVQETYSTGTTTFSGLRADTNYYATVTAIGSGNYGNSAESSASATITTNALPVSPVITSQPTNLIITSGNTASFAVTATRSDGGVLSYQWESATIGSFSNVSGATSATYTTPALTTSSAVTSESATVSVNAITLSTPTAPTGSAVSGSATSITVNYSAVSNSTTYQIRVYTTSGGTLIATVTDTYSTGSVIVSGLTSDTSYYVTVTALGSGNYSDSTASLQSNAIVTNAILAKPGAPTVSATSSALKSIDISWSSVSDSTGYQVNIYNSSGATLLETSTVTSGTSLRLTASQYSGITDGTQYRIALVAIGDSTHLNSPESDKSAVTTNSTAATPTILSHPSSISKSATQSGSFTVSATRTDSGTLNYQWEVSTDSGTTWSNVSDGSGATTATYTTASLTTLLNGYQYRAKVTNSLLGTTAVTYSNAATLSVAKVNQSSLSIITLNGRTDRTLTLITSGGSSGGVVTYTTGDPDCTLSGASLNRTTPGYCPIIATMAGTDTVYNPVSSVEKNIEFADGSNSVDVTFEDNTTNSVFEYQSTRYVSAAVKESGTVKFFQDNRAIPGCTAIKAATGRPATCIWKPSTLGSTSVTAVLTPSNTANPQRTSQPAIATIIPKS